MKGLTQQQLTEILDFVQEHHRFALYIFEQADVQKRKAQFPKLPENRGFGIKYVDFIYDTRDKTVWSIKFRQGKTGWRFATNHFGIREIPKGWKYDNLYDLCMDFLKGEFVAKEEFWITEE